MKTLKFISILLIIGTLGIINIKAQLTFTDVYGNPILTPSWPPPDSLYEQNTITVWFNRTVINQQYLCNYWYNYNNNQFKKDNNSPKDVGFPIGCFGINSQLITDSTLVSTLISLGATRICQYTTFSPCVDTLSYTRNGDTIPTPEFWNCFLVTLDSNDAAYVVQILTLFYGGTKIDYAELNPYVKLDGCTNSQDTPDDYYWFLESNYFNDTQNEIYHENICNAWDFEHGIRPTRVAIIDDGIDYINHQDFNNNICLTCRITDGRVWHLGWYDHLMRPPSNGGGHGTPVAGLIGALVNNGTYEVAGIAGGWGTNGNLSDGISLIDMKVPGDTDQPMLYYNWVNAWIEAAASTSGYQGFGVSIISNSSGVDFYLETIRRALDYAYRSGVTCFSSKGNAQYIKDSYQFHAPADLEYNKIVDVGSYGIDENYYYNPNDPNSSHYVPTRSNHEVPWDPSYWYYVSYYGFGLDLMAQGDHYYPDYLRNCTLADGGGVTWFSHTSAACPQVAGAGALILSNSVRVPNPNFDLLLPEDVQGLLCISALDCRFTYNQRRYDQNGNPTIITDNDTVGYDAKTGYGILKADIALEDIQQPYILKHFSATGGTSVSTKQLANFIVLAPTYGNPLLAPSIPGTLEYRAVMHTIQKEQRLSGMTLARSWGLGGAGTKGWSGQQPVDAQGNSPNYQTGYCRVVGEGIPNDPNFNFNNLRDISYRNDRLILETYCYQVYNKSTNQYLGWYPCSPDNVVYRYTIWGLGTPNYVQNSSLYFESDSIEVRCETKNLFGNNTVLIHYSMTKPGPVVVYIYDVLGNLIAEKKRDVWSSEREQTISVEMSTCANGIYFVVIKDKSSAGFGKFLLIN